jgi:hypothetical protein
MIRHEMADAAEKDLAHETPPLTAHYHREMSFCLALFVLQSQANDQDRPHGAVVDIVGSV